eukprot:894855-Rhodomonas_salina.2
MASMSLVDANSSTPIPMSPAMSSSSLSAPNLQCAQAARRQQCAAACAGQRQEAARRKEDVQVGGEACGVRLALEPVWHVDRELLVRQRRRRCPVAHIRSDLVQKRHEHAENTSVGVGKAAPGAVNGSRKERWTCETAGQSGLASGSASSSLHARYAWVAWASATTILTLTAAQQTRNSCLTSLDFGAARDQSANLEPAMDGCH